MRASWVSTVFNLDWPSAASAAIVDPQQRIAQQRKEMERIVDEAVALGLNCLVFQVKPSADALYRSRILPWSPVLTGQHGGDPGFDPLAEIIALAHAAGLQLHAWLNPYRVATDDSEATAQRLRQVPEGSPASVMVTHPQWIRTSGSRFVLDPGEPGVEDWVASIVAELVQHYAVDGIHLDDYFYAETAQKPLDDAATFARHGAGFDNKGDWRRDNTRRLMLALGQAMAGVRPEVPLGVSCAGVWRNIADDPRGSQTRAGAPNYDVAFADTWGWARDGLVDYLAPQVYWSFARAIVRFDVIVNWWAQALRGTSTQLYIGVALYRVGVPSTVEPDWSLEDGVPEVQRQLDLIDRVPEVQGCMLFRHTNARDAQRAAVADYLRLRWNPDGQAPA